METIGSTGYLIAGSAYFLFTLLLLAAKIRTFSGRIILAGSIVTLVSALMSVVQIHQGLPLKYVLMIENVKYTLWTFLLLSTHLGISHFRQFLAHKLIKKYLFIWGFVSFVCWLGSYYLENSSHYLFVLFLLLCLSAIVVMEQLYRNSDTKAKWALWPLVIAIGTTTVFDFVIFAQATMVNQLDFSFWYARGYLATMAMPMLLVSARRMKDWSVDVFISREVVFYSSMLMISGAYLLVLALAGYAINLVGGKWGNVISIAFLGLGLMVLVALLITEKLRREVKVFITKHFFANKYDYRIEWLKSIEQLQLSKSDDCYQTATDMICSSIGAEKGVLIKKEQLYSYKCMYSKGLAFDQYTEKFLTDVDDFYEHNAWIIDVREYTFVEHSYPQLSLDTDYCRKAGISLIVPILNGDNVYGMFLLSLPSSRGYLNWEDRDLMFALTKQLSNYLFLNEAKNELAESKQFEAFHRMSAFLVHDLKNIQAQLGLISSNAKRHRDNPAFIDDVFETIDSATGRLDKVLTQLRNKQAPETVKAAIDVNVLVEKVIQQRNIHQPQASIERGSELFIDIEEAELESVINHLVQNAQEATDNEGWIKVKVSEKENHAIIEISDNGNGMSDEFIKNRLFKPFDTTKGNAGMGIGAYEAKQFIESVNGQLNVVSTEGRGSVFTVSLPRQ